MEAGPLTGRTGRGNSGGKQHRSEVTQLLWLFHCHMLNATSVGCEETSRISRLIEAFLEQVMLIVFGCRYWTWVVGHDENNENPEETFFS